MPSITYTAENFPANFGPSVIGTHTLIVSWAEIIWAAITVGRAGLGHVLQHGLFSGLEIIYRAALTYANLRESPGGVLVRSPAYDALDRSKKGAMSYFIGMTCAKLFLHRLLNVPWLMHLDVYHQQLQPVLASKSRPDLVGLNTTFDWVVVEAKGRANDYEETVLQKAKVQSQQLSTIQGTQPVLRIGSLAYFSAGDLHFAMRDPKKDSNRRRIPDLPLSKNDLLGDYYRPFQSWLRQALLVRAVIREGRTYSVGYFEELEVSVGLSEEAGAVQIAALRPTHEQSRVADNPFIGRDGVFVQLGDTWSSEKMRLEPQARHRT